jgi:hypothetical protein
VDKDLDEAVEEADDDDSEEVDEEQSEERRRRSSSSSSIDINLHTIYICRLIVAVVVSFLDDVPRRRSEHSYCQ